MTKDDEYAWSLLRNIVTMYEGTIKNMTPEASRELIRNYTDINRAISEAGAFLTNYARRKNRDQIKAGYDAVGLPFREPEEWVPWPEDDTDAE